MKRQKVTIYLSEKNVVRLKEVSKETGVDESVIVSWLIGNHERWIRLERSYSELLRMRIY